MTEAIDPETSEVMLTFQQQRPELRICGHCCEVMQGYASLGDTWLCHTDDKSCYNAVTLHKHPMRCTMCDPMLRYTVTWHETRAKIAKDWTARQWAAYDAEVTDPGCNQRRLSRIRKLWRRKGKGKR